MRYIQFRWAIFGSGLLLFLLLCVPVRATQTSDMTTPGSIGFTGSYQPIGLPEEPVPPTGITPPFGSQLPQTNSYNQYWLLVIGSVLVGGTLYYWKNNSYSHEERRK